MERKNLFLCIALAVLSGCASTRQVVLMPDQNKEVENQEKGRVYVLRPQKTFGGGAPFEIYDNGTFIGQTGPGGSLSWERDPGLAKIESVGSNTSTLDLQVEKQSVHYIEQQLQWLGRSSLRLLGAEEGRSILKQCRLPAGSEQMKPKEKRQKKPRVYFYDENWNRGWSLSALYGLHKAWLLQAKHEFAFSRTKNGVAGLQFGAGYYQTVGSKIRVYYGNAPERRGDINIQALPLSVGLFKYKRRGWFSGKWGIGGTFYSYTGEIDMKDGEGPYTADGTGFGLFLPFEGMVSFGRGDTIVRIDGLIQFAGKEVEFKSGPAAITGVRPYAGTFVGLSVVRRY